MSKGARAFDKDWLEWLRTNVARGCSHAELEGILRGEGFAEAAIRKAFDDVLRAPEPAPIRPAPVAPPRVEPRIPNAKRHPSRDIELYTAEGFLDAAHCADLIVLIRSALRPSTISEPLSGEPDRAFRTSRTCDLVGNDPAIQKLDRKICEALGIDAALAERSQGQLYEAGQQFKPHTDFFKSYELERFSTEHWGQRTWTFMIYLNEPESGGSTNFVDIGLEIAPKRGMAVTWNNLHPSGEGNAKTKHQGSPVLAGTKAIITKWFRMPPAPRAAFASTQFRWTQPAKPLT